MKVEESFGKLLGDQGAVATCPKAFPLTVWVRWVDLNHRPSGYEPVQAIPHKPFKINELQRDVNKLGHKYCIGHFGLFVVHLERYGNVTVT